MLRMLCCSWSQDIDLSSLIRNGGPNLHKIKEETFIYLAPNHQCKECPSIHPSIFYHVYGVRSLGQQPEQLSPALLLTSYFVQLFRGNPMVFPGQPSDTVPPAQLGPPWGPPTSGTCPEYLTREESMRHPN